MHFDCFKCPGIERSMVRFVECTEEFGSAFIIFQRLAVVSPRTNLPEAMRRHYFLRVIDKTLWIYYETADSKNESLCAIELKQIVGKSVRHFEEFVIQFRIPE